MNIRKATANYEAWLRQHLRLLPEDLALKHERMRAELFPFMRGTYYRWAQVWAEVCGEAAKAPVVLAVGDLHVENFGTWRDIEGRLVWGVNDFDEAYNLPYSVDLVRLAASAHIAIREARLEIGARDACNAILGGYKKCLRMGGRPVVLAEEHPWLRAMMTGANGHSLLVEHRSDIVRMDAFEHERNHCSLLPSGTDDAQAGNLR